MEDKVYRVTMVFVKDFKGQTDTDYIADCYGKQTAIDYVRKNEEHFRRQAKNYKMDSDVAVRMEIEEWDNKDNIKVVWCLPLWEKPISKYQLAKEKARQSAIDYHLWSSEHSLSYQELAQQTEIFEKLGKRYGLTKEFKENGII